MIKEQEMNQPHYQSPICVAFRLRQTPDNMHSGLCHIYLQPHVVACPRLGTFLSIDVVSYKHSGVQIETVPPDYFVRRRNHGSATAMSQHE